MPDRIRAKFEELHPYKEGSNQSLYESLYAIFKEGWENGKASSENPPERRYGFCIPVIEAEAGWGTKRDGFMVGFTIEDLKERQKSFEYNNSKDYGLYYERPNEFTPVELTTEATEALMKATDKNCTIWYDRIEQFAKGWIVI